MRILRMKRPCSSQIFTPITCWAFSGLASSTIHPVWSSKVQPGPARCRQRWPRCLQSVPATLFKNGVWIAATMSGFVDDWLIRIKLTQGARPFLSLDPVGCHPAVVGRRRAVQCCRQWHSHGSDVAGRQDGLESGNLQCHAGRNAPDLEIGPTGLHQGNVLGVIGRPTASTFASSFRPS